MMHDYDQTKGSTPYGTNTSSESACTLQPSQRVIKNILNYARCTQCIKLQGLEIKLCLN